ncbi:SCO7613 C-terminal domain-containing membrane protein [Nocardioides sp. zg-DK7169]|uniref:SCO7613 C-terminal domain-containing membrane protein n=1 Tax=Nocardioides sp. zg-DK7169 TaxID=2736600 RepID=UPI003463FCE1
MVAGQDHRTGPRDVLQPPDRRAPDRAGEGRDDRVEGSVQHVAQSGGYSPVRRSGPYLGRAPCATSADSTRHERRLDASHEPTRRSAPVPGAPGCARWRSPRRWRRSRPGPPSWSPGWSAAPSTSLRRRAGARPARGVPGPAPSRGARPGCPGPRPRGRRHRGPRGRGALAARRSPARPGDRGRGVRPPPRRYDVDRGRPGGAGGRGRRGPAERGAGRRAAPGPGGPGRSPERRGAAAGPGGPPARRRAAGAGARRPRRRAAARGEPRGAAGPRAAGARPALTLLLGGVRLRWHAPVAVGAAVGLLLVLRELAPWAAATPQWLLIAAAGALLSAVGVTWERRVADLRRAAAYAGRFR